MEQNESLAWLILLLPLAAVAANLINIAWFQGGNTRVAAQISVGASLAAFLVAAVMYLFLHSTAALALPQVRVTWLKIGDFSVDIGLRLDYLSLLMALVVTGVGSAIHIYSAGYMKGDRAYCRYFACLSLFMFSMLGIVLADNFVMMFIFWELVGISSYLLIGFWYERPPAADACKKAFITNRIGDFGFLLGILTVWAKLGHTVNFEELETYVGQHADKFGAMATVAGLLIFCGAAGKSAQFPLHVWLPDAMEGPTPVSALIHAATMVAAGVYMLCRVSFLFVPGSDAMLVIAWIGGFTALLAALIAIQQNDIKRILAYSTLSQLGYMVMAVGLSGQKAAMYHLTTHAFFKALLFLGAGSVIHAMHHEQNIWKMGALKRKMPVTYWTFMAGTLALCGMWPFSGFYSKDSILAQALAQNSIALFVLGEFVAVLTTFYMFRLVIVAFFGGERSEAVDHAHESPRIMTWPMRALAIMSIIGGVIGIEAVFGKYFAPGEKEAGMGLGQQLLEPFNASPLAAIFGLGAIVFGFSAACALYCGRLVDPLPEKLGWLSRAMRNRFYFDEFYENVLIPCTQEALAKIADAFDRWIIAGLGVRGAHGTTELVGRALRLAQDGSIQTYAFLLAAGLAVILYLVLAG
jgi:NADH-quinone oxidoreductase subunit L